MCKRFLDGLSIFQLFAKLVGLYISAAKVIHITLHLFEHLLKQFPVTFTHISVYPNGLVFFMAGWEFRSRSY